MTYSNIILGIILIFIVFMLLKSLYILDRWLSAKQRNTIFRKSDKKQWHI
jgi:vancomycin permeability regulator SanA